MITQYVLKSFRRRRVRTLLMVLSLVVSTGLIVSMSATVETIRRSNVEIASAEMGSYDLTISLAETNPDLFVTVDEVSARVLAADPLIRGVYPRFSGQAEFQVNQMRGTSPVVSQNMGVVVKVDDETEHRWGNNGQATGTLLAMDPEEGIGQIEVISGTHQLGEMRATVIEPRNLGLGDVQVGDEIEIAYEFRVPREKGKPSPVGASQRRAVERFTVGAIARQPSGMGPGLDQGVIIHIDDAQSFLGLANRADMLIATVDPALYEASNAEAAALSVREVAIKVQAALGDTYQVRAHRAQFIDQAALLFMIMQALVSVYGLMSLAVVGLLVYTLVMTNVQEQRREMAILRILGSQRKILFGIVVVEVIVIGLVGVGLGVVLGQAITMYGVVPLIRHLLAQEGMVMTLAPAVSLRAIAPAIVSAFVVLLVSAIKPARDASRTKVIHAINPGAADNIQLEDLEQLRERRPSSKLFLYGLAFLVIVFVLNGQNLASEFGLPAAQAAIFMLTLVMMIMGFAALFFILTRPMEKLVLSAIGLVAPRVTFFAERNVARGAERNTLISLLVLLSGVLPSFLATQAAISNANIETDTRMWMGSAVRISTWSQFREPEFAKLSYFAPSFLTDELAEIEGIDYAVGTTPEYRARVFDAVEMRTGQLGLVGVTGDLSRVLHEDLSIFTAGGPESLAALLDDPYAVVISQGMAEGLAVPLGGTISVQGEGLDHREELTVVGIAQRLPSLNSIERSRQKALNGGTVLISLEGYRRVTTAPNKAMPPKDDPIVNRVQASLLPGANARVVEETIHRRFGDDHRFWVSVEEAQIERAKRDQGSQQIFLLVLTLLSFVTAVFGVFAVIYVTIYSRRREIGMMKALGARRRELNGMLSVESIAMTLGAALAGIVAGATMAYVFAAIDNAMSQRPQQFAIDTTVMPVIIIMVVLASILGTVLSARRIIKRKAVEILRMS